LGVVTVVGNDRINDTVHGSNNNRHLVILLSVIDSNNKDPGHVIGQAEPLASRVLVGGNEREPRR